RRRVGRQSWKNSFRNSFPVILLLFSVWVRIFCIVTFATFGKHITKHLRVIRNAWQFRFAQV
ncbi:TPA: hypothetical protein ACPHRY_004687, partial [Vibrio antiquarius]